MENYQKSESKVKHNMYNYIYNNLEILKTS